jgi:hypothetical protein
LILDPLILEDEIDKWTDQHTPPSSPRRMSVSEFHDHLTDQILARGALRERAPITACKFKPPGEGQPCGRKTVGGPGALCYDHRASKPKP